uniref:Uncharacterized protein n=1 Tax=Leptobrachium leishanense TaxID=445787 RepID=A0A8C5MLB0_9ANUR
MENIFAEMKVTNESFNISYGVVNFHCAVASCKDVENGIFMVLDSNSNVSLPDYDGEEDSSGDCYVNAVSMSYQPKNGSFNSQYGSQDTSMQGYYLVGEIMTKVLIVGDRNYHDANINMTFKCTEAPCDEKSQCVFWDFLSNMWSTEGCITQVTNGITKCDCNHLTSFAVLMSNSDEPDDPQNTQALDIITRVGLAISILSLIICIVFQLILLSSSGNLTASYRHISTLNISAFLLISNISFLASSFLDPVTQNDICVAFTFCTHFSTLAFFCWTMVQGLFLVCRLVFVFHHVTKREFVGLSVVLGYLCPIIIAMATYLVYSPTKNYRKHDACWLNISSGATLVFTIPVIIIMSVNVLVLIVVIRKLLRPSISEGGGEDEEAVKKMVKAIVFCTPQFGLTWAIGIPLLTKGNSLVLKYMFVLLNPIQGFFILLFTCLLDKKATDLIKKRFRKTSPANSTVTTMSTY